jgi:hypothetical protein
MDELFLSYRPVAIGRARSPHLTPTEETGDRGLKIRLRDIRGHELQYSPCPIDEA